MKKIRNFLIVMLLSPGVLAAPPVLDHGPFRLNVEGLAGYMYLSATPTPLLQVSALTNPLHGLNQGMFIDGGNLGYVGGRFDGNITSYFSFRATPLLRLASSENGLEEGSSFYLQEGLAAINIRKFSIEGGRGNLSWGYGRVGHLLFSGDNAPFTLFRIRTNTPVVPPGFLEDLGPATFEFFYAILDEDRPVFPNEKIMGAYFTFQPIPRFSFGLGQSVLFGGDGAPTNNPFVYFTEKVSDASNPADRNFVLSLRWRIPRIEIEPYTELMVEDCCILPNLFNPRDTANLFGLFLPKIDPEGKLDMSFEWVRTNQITYRHQVYTSGYTFKNRMLGHPLGPDATGIYARVHAALSSALHMQFQYSFEIRGKSGETIDDTDITTVVPTYEQAEIRNRIESNLDWEVRPGFWLSPRLGVESISNANYINSEDRWQVLAGLSLRYEL